MAESSLGKTVYSGILLRFLINSLSVVMQNKPVKHGRTNLRSDSATAPCHGWRRGLIIPPMPGRLSRRRFLTASSATAAAAAVGGCSHGHFLGIGFPRRPVLVGG